MGSSFCARSQAILRESFFVVDATIETEPINPAAPLQRGDGPRERRGESPA